MHNLPFVHLFRLQHPVHTKFLGYPFFGVVCLGFVTIRTPLSVYRARASCLKRKPASVKTALFFLKGRASSEIKAAFSLLFAGKTTCRHTTPLSSISRPHLMPFR